MEKLVQPLEVLMTRGRKFIVFRSIFYPLIVIAFVFSLKSVQPDVPVLKIIILSGIGYSATILWLLAFHFKKILPYIGFPIGTIDITVVTLVFLQIDNEVARIVLSLIYVIIIIPSTLHTSLIEGTYMAVISALEGIVVVLLIKYGIIIPSSSFEFTSLSYYYFVFTAPVVYLLFAVLLGHYAELDRKKSAKLEKLYKIIKVLNQKTQASSEIIIENMTEGLLVLDENGKIIKSNKAAASLLGMDNLFGQHVESINKHIRSDFAKLFTAFKQKMPFTLEINIREPEIRILKATASTLRLKGVLNLIIVLEDITPSWGMVFDAISKMPIRGAIVRIFGREYNRLLETMVTDNEGRFQFLVKPGIYYIKVIKDGYRFPSHAGTGYQGETIEVTKQKKAMINVKIPLDKIIKEVKMLDNSLINQ